MIIYSDNPTDLVYPVLGHGRDGDDLDANQTGVAHGETVGITRPVQRVNVPGPLGDLTHHSVLLQHRGEMMAVVGAYLQADSGFLASENPVYIHLLSYFFYNCIVPVGFLQWKIRVAFPGESQLRQRRAT